MLFRRFCLEISQKTFFDPDCLEEVEDGTRITGLQRIVVVRNILGHTFSPVYRVL